MVEGEVDIAQSLQILFTTRLHERVLHHGYGADLEAFTFEDIDQKLIGNLEKIITEAVENYEPRIQLERVDFILDREREGEVLMEMEFTINSTNSRHNIVYPFNLAEGSLYHQIIST
jgi:uncharacterized protein